MTNANEPKASTEDTAANETEAIDGQELDAQIVKDLELEEHGEDVRGGRCAVAIITAPTATFQS